jgi:TonB family protein
MTVRPEIRNRGEIQRALMTQYPAMLRNAGIGGTVEVWFFISEEGRVLDRKVFRSSGYVQLDEAALRVADVFRFTPALNREKIVQVWIRFPIEFQVQSYAAP